MKVHKASIPWLMAGGRALLGPVLVLGERCGWSGFALASLVITALLSDIFDGILARRWRCDTAGVRLFDSMADTGFYLCVAITLWLRFPLIWQENAILLGAVFWLEALRFGLDFAKYGKPASYHSYLAKTWGLVMALAVIASFASASNACLPIALALGVASNLEGLAMSLMLPLWRKDVKTLAAAWRIRSDMTGSPMRPSPGRGPATVVTAVLLALLAGATQALALDHNQAVYIGGSAAVGSDTPGALDTTSPTTLFFRYRNPDGTAGQIGIDYAAIRNAYMANEATHHLGVAPAIAVGLLAARRHRHFVTITWADPADIAQVAEIEVSGQDQTSLMAVLRARMRPPCERMRTQCAQSRPTPTR